jgi:WD40 repeat protein/serine/threonine protein kinase
MPACPAPDRLQALLADTLAPDERDALDAHLSECSACRRSLDEMTDAGLREWRRLVAGSGTIQVPFIPAGALPAPVVDHPANPSHLQLADYEILGELGRGGMGVVWKAQQRSLDRLVALKVMTQAAGAGAAERERFRREAQTAARLRHPNVVQVYEVGESAGTLYLAMEHVPGGTLADWLAGNPQPARAAAELIETLARTMHFAHEQGVVHRDLKPANILLSRKSETNSLPASDFEFRVSDFELKVADFGLARLLAASSGPTRTSDLLGTPSYMAPEQAASRHEIVGPATDVWALGAILYEALTGRPPFKAALPLLTLDQVVHHDPAPPSQLVPGVPRDLETICLKCLRKEPERRYATAQALADDLRRFLDGRPVLARPVGPLERAWKWSRANPLPSILLALVVFTLAVGATVATVLALWALDRSTEAENRRKDAEKREKERDEANSGLKRELDRKRRALYASQVVRAERELGYDNRPEARALLDGCEEDLRGWEWYHLRQRLEGSRVTLTVGKPVQAVAFSPDGKLLAFGGADNTVHLWDVSAGRELAVCRGHTSEVCGVCFSPDGRRLASTGMDRTVRVWDTATGRPVFSCPLAGRELRVVAYSPDGRRLVGAGPEVIRVWDAADGHERATLLRGACNDLAHAPDGRLLAACPDGVRLFDAAGRETRFAVPEGVFWNGVAVRPDGKRVAAVGGRLDRKGVLWIGDETGRTIATFDDPGLMATRVAFTADPERLVTGEHDGAVRLWEVETARPVETFRGHIQHVYRVASSPDGRWLASAGHDGTVKLWAPGPQHAVRIPHGTYIAFAPDGKALATGGPQTEVRVWDPVNGRELARCIGHKRPVSAVAFGPGSVAAAASDGDVDIRVWDAVTGAERAHLPLSRAVLVTALAFDREGSRLFIGQPGALRTWSLAPGATSTTVSLPGVHQVFAVAPAPEEDRLALGTANRGLLMRTVAGETLQDEASPQATEVRGVAYSRDGRWLATAGDGVVRVEDAATGEPRFTLKVQGASRTVSFSPDGSRLAADDKAGVTVWELETGLVVLRLKEPGTGNAGLRVAFSPDGRRLAVGNATTGGVTVWAASPAR